MKKNKISKNWVNKQRRDIYVRQSKVDGYRARSAYKLIEIDEKGDDLLSEEQMEEKKILFSSEVLISEFFSTLARNVWYTEATIADIEYGTCVTEKKALHSFLKKYNRNRRGGNSQSVDADQPPTSLLI